ncbi:MAG: sugar phosphate isomerase/epimerase [Clostridiales bacterium]|nr:sugar phosphate isomerase/epimerase [Clostridiales bacterium]
MYTSTMITDIDDFDFDLFSEHNIGIEIQTFPQHILDSNINALIERWKRGLSGFNSSISLHGSSFDLNPGSTDSKIVEVTRMRYLQSIQIADSLNASHVIFHSQVNPLLSVRRIQDLKLNNQIEFWKDLFNKEIPSNINIMIENEYDETYEDLKKIIDDVNRPNLGICLDIGHALAYSKISIEEWINKLGDRIKYIHLHWNDGMDDEHRAPTDEELFHLNQILKKNGLSPKITMEYWVDDVSLEVERIRKYLLLDRDYDNL